VPLTDSALVFTTPTITQHRSVDNSCTEPYSKEPEKWNKRGGLWLHPAYPTETGGSFPKLKQAGRETQQSPQQLPILMGQATIPRSHAFSWRGYHNRTHCWYTYRQIFTQTTLQFTLTVFVRVILANQHDFLVQL
jgi:hypothetical protein